MSVTSVLQKFFVDKTISDKEEQGTEDQNASNNRERYTSAPYMQGTSERVGKILKDYDIKLCHKPTKTLRQDLCCMKDRRKAQDQAGVVYKIECNDCSSV